MFETEHARSAELPLQTDTVTSEILRSEDSVSALHAPELYLSCNYDAQHNRSQAC